MPAWLCYLALAVLGAACGNYGSSKVVSRVSMAHGIKLGDFVPPTPLDCGLAAQRTLGAPHRVDLVTFASNGDCSVCQAHLLGLQAMHTAHRLTPDDYIVLWAPDSQDVRSAAFLRRESNRPICLGGGALWQRYHLSHTPVTALVNNGRIVYLHDEPLASEFAQDSLAADLRSLLVIHE